MDEGGRSKVEPNGVLDDSIKSEMMRSSAYNPLTEDLNRYTAAKDIPKLLSDGTHRLSSLEQRDSCLPPLHLRVPVLMVQRVVLDF
jgi:hypothetical protein